MRLSIWTAASFIAFLVRAAPAPTGNKQTNGGHATAIRLL